MNQPRIIAYNLILDWYKNGTFPNLALKNVLRSVSVPRDKRFITALVYGVIERKLTLEYFIGKVCDRPVERLDKSVLVLLQMGIYQAFYMNVPPSAACDTTVELAHSLKLRYCSGLINAVLRRCCDEQDELKLLRKTDFSVRYSISTDLTELLISQYGKETFVQMMERLSEHADFLYIYHHQKKCSSDELKFSLKKEGVTIQETSLPHLFCCVHGFAVDQTYAFQNGFFHIVGPHSAETALQMPDRAETVIDLCAAPGGKTFILSENCAGTVYAFDIHSHKIDLMKKDAARLKQDNVLFQTADSTLYHAEFDSTADFVLCDVPCSGLGMIARKPDIKYKTLDFDSLKAVQETILRNGARYLKPAGVLTYSTCTINITENEEIVYSFLREKPGFRLCEMKTYLPGIDGDGFFIAVFRKDQI